MKTYIKAGAVAILLAVFTMASFNTAQAAERHPEIRRAIHALERAKVDLQAGAHDFGGHRVAALQACDQAIAQLNIALQYDRQ